MSLSLALFILAVIFVVGWFAVGTQYNIRKGHDVMRWLQDGLPTLGEKTHLRWLGSSVVELKIQRAKAPFRSATILLVLEPRDVPPLWAFARLRGRRDLFIFRGVLENSPHTELEALDPNSWSTRGLARQLNSDQWTQISMPQPMAVYVSQHSPAANDLVSVARLDDCPLMRLAIHRDEPHLEVQWHFDPLRHHSATEVFETLFRLAKQI